MTYTRWLVGYAGIVHCFTNHRYNCSHNDHDGLGFVLKEALRESCDGFSSMPVAFRRRQFVDGSERQVIQIETFHFEVIKKRIRVSESLLHLSEESTVAAIEKTATSRSRFTHKQSRDSVGAETAA